MHDISVVHERNDVLEEMGQTDTVGRGERSELEALKRLRAEPISERSEWSESSCTIIDRAIEPSGEDDHRSSHRSVTTTSETLKS